MELPGTKEYTSLREWMLDKSALDALGNPLIRLGALYHLDDHYDDDVVIEKLKTLLRSADEDTQLHDKMSDALFYLHAAISLANKNDFEGVNWIVRALATAPDKNKKFAEIALGSCYHFPLATILTLALDLSIKEDDIASLEELIKYSEDDFIDWSQKPQNEQGLLFNNLVDRIDGVRKLNRKPGYELGIGTILKRPVQYDIGFPYTGFISLGITNGEAWVLPYEPSMVINKNNPSLRQSIWQMQAYAGRKAIIVYKNTEPFEVKYIYLLPFALLSQDEQEARMMDLLMHGHGAELAIVHSKWSTERGDRYRLITSKGYTSVRSFMANKQRLGNIFIIHPDNPQPLSTKYSINVKNIPDIVNNFIKNTNLDFAVNVAHLTTTKRTSNLILSGKGNYWKQPGDSNFERSLYAIEEAPWGLSPFMLVENYPTPDRVLIINNYFGINPGNYGVVMENLIGNDGHLLAKIITADGQSALRPIDEKINPGTPVFHRSWFDDNNKERQDIIILSRFKIEGACRLCYGIGYSVCWNCHGEARSICPICKGEGNVTCNACQGSQKCDNCGGRGYYADSGKSCPKCGTTGICKYCRGKNGKVRCKEPGCFHGRIPCPTCSGNRIIKCDCGGTKKGKIVER